VDNRKYIAPQEAKALFAKRGEFAVLDVREQEEFSRGHMLLASCAPLSRLEILVSALVPCRKVPVILVDSGEERVSPRAERACRVLAAMGYARPVTLTGGMKAWLGDGYVEFTGVGALSKGFGEYVEEEQRTPRLDPRAVKALVDSGEDHVIIDVRPTEEYGNMHIPGGINAPGCEVTYRFADLVPNDAATVIINCAGRTRSIIGAQTLRNAGIPNKVVALKGGTMNWQLAGYPLEYGAALRTAPPSPRALDVARKRAASVAGKYGISFVAGEKLREWQAESGERTLYIFDVRQPEEYALGHIPGSRNAQGGQLVQATDEYAAVRNARYVLVDDTEVRAIMTAHWLKQMGLPDVHVLGGGLGGSGFGNTGLQHGPEPSALPVLPEVRAVSAQELREKLAGANPSLTVIDAGVSSLHRKGHIPGAAWVARSYLELARTAYPEAKDIVLTSDSDIHARLSAADAAGLWPDASVSALRGGTPSWIAAEFPLEQGMPTALCAEDDVWYKPYTDIHAGPEAMKGYFDWEFGLVQRIKKDGDVVFPLVR
jgi:rhodanese-related sulfurtransferase